MAINYQKPEGLSIFWNEKKIHCWCWFFKI